MPPEGLAVKVPSLSPKQETRTLLKVGMTIFVGCVRVTLAVSVHPALLVTVTVKVPADNGDAVWELEPLLHEYVYGVVPPEAAAVAEPLLLL